MYPANDWPSVNQLSMSSDRAMLTVLDVCLELTTRSLRAEHPGLCEQPYRGATEPPPTHEALAASIVLLATTLREVIAGYRDCLDHIFGDRPDESTGDRVDDQPF
jgi:hypothetical protein